MQRFLELQPHNSTHAGLATQPGRPSVRAHHLHVPVSLGPAPQSLPLTTAWGLRASLPDSLPPPPTAPPPQPPDLPTSSPAITPPHPALHAFPSRPPVGSGNTLRTMGLRQPAPYPVPSLTPAHQHHQPHLTPPHLISPHLTSPTPPHPKPRPSTSPPCPRPGRRRLPRVLGAAQPRHWLRDRPRPTARPVVLQHLLLGHVHLTRQDKAVQRQPKVHLQEKGGVTCSKFTE